MDESLLLVKQYQATCFYMSNGLTWFICLLFADLNLIQCNNVWDDLWFITEGNANI